jgi:hypothetical protein
MKAVPKGRAKVYGIAQIILSSLGFLGGIFGGLIMLLAGLFSNFIPADAGIGGKTVLVSGWSAIMVGIANIPGFLTALHHLQGKQSPSISASLLKKTQFFLLAAFAVSIPGLWLTSRTPALDILSALFIVLLVLIPILFFFWIGSGKFSLGSKTRTWGAVVFNFSTLMPVVIFVEIIIFLFAAILLGLWVFNRPDLLEQITRLVDELSSAMIDPAAAEAFAKELLKEPVLLIGGALLITLVVPMVEEFLKPMAIWFLAGRNLTPSQGFVGGLIGGACFSLLETLGSAGMAEGNDLFVLLLARTATGLLHIALSGLVGWGFASAFYNKKWLFAIGTYLLAVVLHGTWNFFAIFSGLASFLPVMEESIQNLSDVLGKIAVFALVVLFMINFAVLMGSRIRLEKSTRQNNNPEL